MRAKPEMKPWENRGHKNYELRRSGTITRAFVLRLGSAAPLGLNRCVPIINPGLAPWAMQEYRPYRAPLHLPNQFTLLLLTSFAIVIDYCVTFVVQARVTHTNRSWTVVPVGGSMSYSFFRSPNFKFSELP